MEMDIVMYMNKQNQRKDPLKNLGMLEWREQSGANAHEKCASFHVQIASSVETLKCQSGTWIAMVEDAIIAIFS
jgi:hypothetical protein